MTQNNDFSSKSFSKMLTNELISDSSLSKKLNSPRLFVRECYIYGGNMSNPSKTYHIEFTLSNEKAQKLLEILTSFNLQPKMIARGGQFVVYIKEAEGIADILNIIGAHKTLLAFEELRVKKHTGNNINRKVNFETANLDKTVRASVDHIEAIRQIDKHIGLLNLPPSLQEIASLRIANEDASLTVIGQLANPKLSKSGVNHRLRKLSKLAESLQKSIKTQ